MLYKIDLIAKQTIMCKIKAKKYQTWQYLHKSSKNRNMFYLFLGHPSICAEEIYFKNTILAFESFLAIFFSETGHRKKEMQIFIFTFVSPNVERALCKVEINSIFGSLANFLSLPHIRFTLRNLKQYPMSFKTKMAR
jgi:hypothetical protein